MQVPDRGPGPYDRGQEPPLEPRPVDRGAYRESRLEPVEREHYVQETRVVEVGSMLQWGSIWGGVVGAFGVLVVLRVVGLIAGLNAAGASTTGQLGTAPVIWGAIVALVAFFVGGWIAGRTTSHPTGGVTGFITGSMVWVLGAVFVALLAALGTGGGVGAALGGFGIPNIMPPLSTAGTVQSAAVGTLVALVLTYVACVLGAIIGTSGARGYYDTRIR